MGIGGDRGTRTPDLPDGIGTLSQLKDNTKCFKHVLRIFPVLDFAFSTAGFRERTEVFCIDQFPRAIRFGGYMVAGVVSE
jgi:hypothetical protein